MVGAVCFFKVKTTFLHSAAPPRPDFEDRGAPVADGLGTANTLTLIDRWQTSQLWVVGDAGCSPPASGFRIEHTLDAAARKLRAMI